MTFFLHRFRKLDMTQEKHRQALIDTFVNAVFVHDDKILIGYNFQDGTRTITLTDVQTATDESGSDLEMFGVPNKQEGYPSGYPSCLFRAPHGRDSKGRHQSADWCKN